MANVNFGSNPGSAFEMNDNDMLIPDLTEPIVACRAWAAPDASRGSHAYAHVSPKQRYLRSTGTKNTWQPGRNEALCPRTGFSYTTTASVNVLTPTGMMSGEPLADLDSIKEVPPPPHRNESCGLWSLATWQEVFNRFDTRDTDFVFGMVELTGRVLPGTDGWRSQFATITGLVAPYSRFSRRNRFVASIARLYGVPLLYDLPELTYTMTGIPYKKGGV
jgi:hypothetical protein